MNNTLLFPYPVVEAAPTVAFLPYPFCADRRCTHVYHREGGNAIC